MFKKTSTPELENDQSSLFSAEIEKINLRTKEWEEAGKKIRQDLSQLLKCVPNSEFNLFGIRKN